MRFQTLERVIEKVETFLGQTRLTADEEREMLHTAYLALFLASVSRHIAGIKRVHALVAKCCDRCANSTVANVHQMTSHSF